MDIEAALVFFGVLLLSTLCLGQDYCNCGPATIIDSNLGATALQGDSTSIADTTNCPGVIGPRDLTAQEADVTTGSTYTLNTAVTSCGGNFGTVAGAWIDWNQNLVFDGPERIANFTTLKTVVWAFTVPPGGDSVTGIVGGKTRMRVMVQETSAASIDPCGMFQYGATKDFSIMVKTTGGGGGSGGGSGGLSGGSIFIIIVLVASVFYVAVGCFFNRFRKGTTGLKESCPQGDFWFDLPTNFIEGFRFTKRKICGGGGGGYESLGGGGGGNTIDQNDL